MDKRELTNAYMTCAFLPDDGGRLVSLIDAQGHEYMWTNERTSGIPRYYGANYDDLLAGGVEEAFPTALPDVLDGQAIPFFGEVWAIPWTCEQTGDSLALSCFCAQFPVRALKTYRLVGNCLYCRYELQNIGKEPVSYLFGVHASLRVGLRDRLDMPAGVYGVSSVKNAGTLAPGMSVKWPFTADGRDLRAFFRDHSTGECIELCREWMEESGICVYGEHGGTLQIDYDARELPAISLWLIGGGWRGHECMMIEYYTGYPYRLSEAIAQKRASALEPGASWKTTVTYTVNEVKHV